MSNKLFALIIAATSLFFTSNAHAQKLLLEPYAGYQKFSADRGNHEYSGSGLVFGGKVGFTYTLLMAGLSYDYSSNYDLEDESAGTKNTSEVSARTLGLFVGAELPLVRACAAYYPSSSIEYEEGPATNDQYKGNGFGLGAGLKIIPLLAINLEYRWTTYDEYEDASPSQTTTLAEDLEGNQLLLTLSVPLTF